jgi:hypothetical protein
MSSTTFFDFKAISAVPRPQKGISGLQDADSFKRFGLNLRSLQNPGYVIQYPLLMPILGLSMQNWHDDPKAHPYSKLIGEHSFIFLTHNSVFVPDSQNTFMDRNYHLIFTDSKDSINSHFVNIGSRSSVEFADFTESTAKKKLNEEGKHIISKSEFFRNVLYAYVEGHTDISKCIPSLNHLFSVYNPLKDSHAVLLTPNRVIELTTEQNKKPCLYKNNKTFFERTSYSHQQLRDNFQYALSQAIKTKSSIESEYPFNTSKSIIDVYRAIPTNVSLRSVDQDKYRNCILATNLPRYTVKTEVGTLEFDATTIELPLLANESNFSFADYPRVQCGYEHLFVFSTGGICYDGDARFEDIGLTEGRFHKYTRSNALKLAQVLQEGPKNLMHGYSPTAKPFRKAIDLAHRRVSA